MKKLVSTLSATSVILAVLLLTLPEGCRQKSAASASGVASAASGASDPAAVTDACGARQLISERAV